ncbi:MAG: ABC transporter ATP-binding protein/permease [Treponema sp.]|jgi:ATP-binding cassette subfamily B protein|nr:ABC transporter ATP-binding protein/permease [Treponema sp.]
MSGEHQVEVKKDGSKPKVSLREFKTLRPYLSRYRWRYFWGFVCLITVDAAQIIIPQFIRRAVDLISAGNFSWSRILFLSLWMIGVMTVISAGRFLWRYFIHGSSRRIETEMREQLFDHLLTLSWDFYQKNKIGDLMARSINDLNAVRMAIGMGLVALVDFIVMATSILIIIFIQDARSAALAVIPLPLVTLLILFFGSAVGKRFRWAQEAYSKMSDTVQETFAGIRVVKSFVKEGWFIKKFADTNDDYRRANMELTKLFGFFFPFVSFLSGLTVLIMLLIGGVRVVEGYMSPGSLVALFRYLQMLIWPLMGAGFTVTMIQRGAVSLHRVNEVMNAKPSISSPAEPKPAPDIAGIRPAALPAIEIKNLNFAYSGGTSVLADINLTVERGQWLGIMGRTGSGKSTLIKTLPRMVDPPRGTVFVFGLDVREWDLERLRSLFASAPQDSYLFSDSIKNNIGYGLEAPAEEAVKKAADISALEKDLETFNSGWETLIGERGLTLSGGQKQRVALSRALMMDSEILILDDSLSAVDAETEQRILAGMLRERQGRTTIIISHRVSTLRHADRIAVLDQGRISEYGKPRELLARSGYYARMAALQQLDGREDAAFVEGGFG